MSVKSCSKSTFEVYEKAWEKSMLLQFDFLRLVDHDYPLLILPCVNGEEFLECAF